MQQQQAHAGQMDVVSHSGQAIAAVQYEHSDSPHTVSQTSYTGVLKNICLRVAQTFKLACTATPPPTHCSEKSTSQLYSLMHVDLCAL